VTIVIIQSFHIYSCILNETFKRQFLIFDILVSFYFINIYVRVMKPRWYILSD